MTGGRCQCCDILVEFCTRTEQDAVAKREKKIMEALEELGFIPSQYPGVCRVCGNYYDPGEMIKGGHGPSRWRSTCCMSQWEKERLSEKTGETF